MAVDAAEALLDRYTPVRVTIEADGFARVTVAGAPKVLVEQGWRVFLVCVSNSLKPIGCDSATQFGEQRDTIQECHRRFSRGRIRHRKYGTRRCEILVRLRNDCATR